MSRAPLLALAALVAIPFGPAAGHASTPSLIVFSADRLPLFAGEVYRADPSGHRVDLSRSPSSDTQPLVSPDGKHVAFFSDRSGAIGVYEVRIGGTHLRNVGPPSPQEEGDSLAWQPHGPRLAAITTGRAAVDTLWILRSGHKPRRVYSSRRGVLEPSWSPDGRVLLAWSGGAWRGFSPSGRRLWAHETPSGCCGASWSTLGLLAISTEQALAVYDESGQRRFRVPERGLTGAPAWSSDGNRVAISSARNLEVRSASGQLILRKSVPGMHGVTWANENRVVLGNFGRCYCEAKALDIRTGRASPTSDRWFDPLSSDRKFAAVISSRRGSNFSLGVGRTGGGKPNPYAGVSGCWDDRGWEAAVDSVQFVGRGRSLVYASACYEPFSNLYSVAPDGTGLREITGAKPYATQPAVSPGGDRIAYSWAQFAGLSCKGCVSEIRVVNADGSGMRVLAKPNTDCEFDFSPTWSPDGQTILFSHESCSYPSELCTVPAAGGSPHDLHVVGDHPAWGPSRIAYINDGIWTANPDGSDPVKVAKDGVQPAWSPDGRLAYRVGRFGNIVAVGSTQVTLPFASVTSLSWSPDGTRFVVTARRTITSPIDLYTIRTDGTDPVQLTENYDASGASWR